MIYWNPISGLYFFSGSILEKCGNLWKNGRFSGRIWPDWGNTARADMAGLGSIGLSEKDVFSWFDSLVMFFFKKNRFKLFSPSYNTVTTSSSHLLSDFNTSFTKRLESIPSKAVCNPALMSFLTSFAKKSTFFKMAEPNFKFPH